LSVKGIDRGEGHNNTCRTASESEYHLNMIAATRLSTHRLKAFQHPRFFSANARPRPSDSESIVPYLRTKYDERLAQHAMLARRSNASILSLKAESLSQLPPTDLSSSTVARIQSDIEEMFGFGSTSPKDVFINNELDLARVETYGFGKY
jgi:hypothetical protein